MSRFESQHRGTNHGVTTHVSTAFYQSCLSHPTRDVVLIGSRLSSAYVQYTLTDVRTSITAMILCDFWSCCLIARTRSNPQLLCRVPGTSLREYAWHHGVIVGNTLRHYP